MNIWEAVSDLARAMAGMAAVLGAWFALQLFLRKRSGCRNPDKDILDFMLNGCGGGGCGGKGECHSKKTGDAHISGIRGAQ
ncbi:MAG: hypothetical protein JNM66_10940 [Bryobacterales bacterium]|nr:hypothetical protein [Bryobacterales bacterium]